MTESNPGGLNREPVFPNFQEIPSDRGLILRDYLAAHALVIFNSWPSAIEPGHVQDLAEGAYKIADAMLKAREEPKK